MKTIGRDKIRGKHLDHKCYDAETVRPKYNPMFVFCRGYDTSKDCQRCKAFMPKEDYEREDFIR